MKKIVFVFLILGGLVILAGIIYFNQKVFQVNQPVISPMTFENEKNLGEVLKNTELILPISEFEKRITKKPFGILITPETSPVQPERFSGYHTGVDVEYDDVQGQVPVLAICDGEVVLARWVSGYGGAIGLECVLESEKIYVFYGHLNPQSLVQKTQVKKGETIAYLGQGQTRQTDFERKHLHFSLNRNQLDLRGYVKNEAELSDWYNPQDFYR